MDTRNAIDRPTRPQDLNPIDFSLQTHKYQTETDGDLKGRRRIVFILTFHLKRVDAKPPAHYNLTEWRGG